MKTSITKMLAVAAMSVATFSAPLAAVAQESENRVAANTDWYVFEESAPQKQCWSASPPKESLNTDQNGRVKAVRRGAVLLMVTYMPSSGINGQVSFIGGYPFKGGSTVTLEISGSKYELFTEGETAWPATAADDAKIITAMKRGAKAVLSGGSARGTRTKDTFSLLGFTASLAEASKRCP
jgi:invasion associated locus B (IalB) protein